MGFVMFDIALLVAAGLVVLYVAIRIVAAPFAWLKDRHLRKELKALGVDCEHVSGVELQLLHAETGLNAIRNAQRGTV